MTAEPQATTTEPLKGEALKEAVRKQIEYYFSRTNMASDAYLLSMMDSDFYVNISVIAGFGKIKSLNADEAVIVEAVKSSDQVALDETGTKVKPNMQQKRSTLILRDIPKETPVEEIEALFKGGKKPDSIRPDIMNTWFVAFDTEEDTVAAVERLRSAKFQGKPVRCALKSETVIKSLTYIDPRTYVDPASFSNNNNNNNNGYRQQYPRGGQQNNEGRRRGGGAGNRRPGGRDGAVVNNAANNAGNTSNANAAANNNNANNGASPAAGNAPAASSPAANSNAANNNNNGNNAAGANNANNNGAAAAAAAAGGRTKRKNNRNRKEVAPPLEKPAPAPPAQVVLTSAHFPPLPNNYSKGFKKYTREQLLEIIKSTEPAKIESVDGTCVVVLPTPDNKLEAERVDSGEHDRRVSMDFDLSHVAKQAVASATASASSGVPAGVEEEPTESQRGESSEGAKDDHHSPSKVSYAAMLGKKAGKA